MSSMISRNVPTTDWRGGLPCGVGTLGARTSAAVRRAMVVSVKRIWPRQERGRRESAPAQVQEACARTPRIHQNRNIAPPCPVGPHALDIPVATPQRIGECDAYACVSRGGMATFRRSSLAELLHPASRMKLRLPGSFPAYPR